MPAGFSTTARVTAATSTASRPVPRPPALSSLGPGKARSGGRSLRRGWEATSWAQIWAKVIMSILKRAFWWLYLSFQHTLYSSWQSTCSCDSQAPAGSPYKALPEHFNYHSNKPHMKEVWQPRHGRQEETMIWSLEAAHLVTHPAPALGFTDSSKLVGQVLGIARRHGAVLFSPLVHSPLRSHGAGNARKMPGPFNVIMILWDCKQLWRNNHLDLTADPYLFAFHSKAQKGHL